MAQSSRHRGVRKRILRKKIQFDLQFKDKHIAYFADEDDAGRAYDKLALEAYGDKARLNFPEEDNTSFDIDAAKAKPKGLAPVPKEFKKMSKTQKSLMKSARRKVNIP